MEDSTDTGNSRNPNLNPTGEAPAIHPQTESTGDQTESTPKPSPTKAVEELVDVPFHTQKFTMSEIAGAMNWIQDKEVKAGSDYADKGRTLQDYVLSAAVVHRNRAQMKALAPKPLVRELGLRSGRQVNLGKSQNAEAAVAYRVGDPAEAACTKCSSGSNPFPVCVVVPGALKDACAGCHYNGDGKKCSLRADVGKKEKSRKQAKTDDDNSDEEDVVERPKRGATPGSKRRRKAKERTRSGRRETSPTPGGRYALRPSHQKSRYEDDESDSGDLEPEEENMRSKRARTSTRTLPMQPQSLTSNPLTVRPAAATPAPTTTTVPTMQQMLGLNDEQAQATGQHYDGNRDATSHQDLKRAMGR